MIVRVLIYQGSSASGGHYVADVLDWDSSKWWNFNDDIVTPTGNPAHNTNTPAKEVVEDLTERDDVSGDFASTQQMVNLVDDSDNDEDGDTKINKRGSGSKRGRKTVISEGDSESDYEDNDKQQKADGPHASASASSFSASKAKRGSSDSSTASKN